MVFWIDTINRDRRTENYFGPWPTGLATGWLLLDSGSLTMHFMIKPPPIIIKEIAMNGLLPNWVPWFKDLPTAWYEASPGSRQNSPFISPWSRVHRVMLKWSILTQKRKAKMAHLAEYVLRFLSIGVPVRNSPVIAVRGSLSWYKCPNLGFFECSIQKCSGTQITIVSLDLK